jgi:long-chain acyl-CoA synthetase
MQKISDPKVCILLKTPIIGRKIKEKICQGLRNAFGGNFYEVVIGGAAMNQEVEALLKDIGFNFTVGYGATECAPLISCEDWKKFVPTSCGKVVKRMQIKIDSRNPYEIPGEILVKGQNVMLGYYKNPEATAETLANGWYHTGDLGIMDRHGNIFIKGRIKNMLLSSNGQNIYPEEIEDKLNNLPYVQECVVVQREDKLYGLVYPDPELIKKTNISPALLSEKMEDNRKILNKQLPLYEQLAGIIVCDQEFEKTPKRSIKRFMYS